MGRQISEDLKRRMQRARKRKELGYTHHLEIAGRMAKKKIEALFKEWGLDVNESLFTIESMDFECKMLFDLSVRGVKFGGVIPEVLKQARVREVRDVVVECSYEGVLRETEETGNIIFVKKKGLEYLIESHKEWNERIKA